MMKNYLQKEKMLRMHFSEKVLFYYDVYLTWLL